MSFTGTPGKYGNFSEYTRTGDFPEIGGAPVKLLTTREVANLPSMATRPLPATLNFSGGAPSQRFHRAALALWSSLGPTHPAGGCVAPFEGSMV